MNLILVLAAVGLGLGLGLLIGIILHKSKLQRTFDTAQKESEDLFAEAQKERERILREAHQEAKSNQREKRQQFEQELKKRRSEVTKLENKMKSREEAIEKKLAILEKKEGELERATEQIEQEEQTYKKLISDCERSIQESRNMLENVAKMSQEQARNELVKSLEKEARKAAQKTIQEIEEEARAEGERRAQSTVSLAVQRVCSEYVNDSTITVVGLPSDDMKGRIIGREGRNIRALEQETGIDLIIDDTPEAVILSCFNPIRREIAKIALERLIADGRIHPARIEETVKKVTTEFDQIIQENGEQAAFDTGITDLHPELIKMLGKLKYRTTGQQTVLQHSVEVAHICGIMAGEMGADIKQAKRAGLLHDIGKAADQETEGHHADIGAQICSKYHESSVITEAIARHHSDNLTNAHPLSVILHAANILSANRPGARKELLETYVKRLNSMERIVHEFDGIDTAFVIQAGREIRAMVKPDGINDEQVMNLSSDIASRLRQEVSFAGQVKVTVLRESKYMEFAK